MIPDVAKRFDLGLSVTPAEAMQVCQRREAGDRSLSRLGFLNIGFESDAPPPLVLRDALRRNGLWVGVHAIDLNFSEVVSQRNLDQLVQALEPFDVAWVEEDVGIWEWDGMFLGAHHLAPMLDQETIEPTVRELRRVHRALGLPLLIENPPVYWDAGSMDMWDYMAEIAGRADCGLVVDVGHMIGYYVNSDQPARIAPPSWPGWKRVRELHFSGYSVQRLNGKDVWFDRHDLAFDDTHVNWAREIVGRLDHPVAVLLELEGAPDEIVSNNIAVIADIVGPGTSYERRMA
jgi:uncharacterized protein (UPF0276 family)